MEHRLKPVLRNDEAQRIIPSLRRSAARPDARHAARTIYL